MWYCNLYFTFEWTIQFKTTNKSEILGELICVSFQIWPKIRNVLEEQNSLGGSLALRCQIHHDRVTAVAKPNDFLKVAEGGCDLLCNVDLVCGHKCKSLCHVLKRDHAEYQCMEKCMR